MLIALWSLANDKLVLYKYIVGKELPSLANINDRPIILYGKPSLKDKLSFFNPYYMYNVHWSTKELKEKDESWLHNLMNLVYV